MKMALVNELLLDGTTTRNYVMIDQIVRIAAMPNHPDHTRIYFAPGPHKDSTLDVLEPLEQVHKVIEQVATFEYQG